MNCPIDWTWWDARRARDAARRAREKENRRTWRRNATCAAIDAAIARARRAKAEG